MDAVTSLQSDDGYKTYCCIEGCNLSVLIKRTLVTMSEDFLFTDEDRKVYDRMYVLSSQLVFAHQALRHNITTRTTPSGVDLTCSEAQELYETMRSRLEDGQTEYRESARELRDLMKIVQSWKKSVASQGGDETVGSGVDEPISMQTRGR
jgi:hypothetical protein